MDKINWKQKLTSRKFWAAVVTFVSTILVAFGVPDMTVDNSIIIGKGLVDAARLKAQNKNEDKQD